MANPIRYSVVGKTFNELFQWDTNQKLVLESEENLPITNFQFSHEQDDDALVVLPEVDNNTYTVSIPNILLQRAGTLFVYICNDSDAYTHTTLKYLTIPIRGKQKPCNYVYEENVEYVTVEALVKHVEKLEEVIRQTDAKYYFSSLDDAKYAASTAVEFGKEDSLYFYGDLLVVVTGDDAILYIIQPDKSLSEVGSSSGGTQEGVPSLKLGHGLRYDEFGRVEVQTANVVEADNTLPVTSAAVNVTVGNIEVILSTI